MTNYGTIKLPRATYERHNERRKEMGLTWEAYIDGEAPDVPNASEGLGYDDVRNACEAALDEKLPDGLD